MKRDDLIAPAEAKIRVGRYPDGSGPVATVSFDRTSENTPNAIWVETSSDRWIAFDWRHADELCAAIQRCARALAGDA